jgi:hypothetical protein
MSEVSVVFQGMILWWTVSSPAVVLVPNLTAPPSSHTASISAPVSAFAGGACPAGFIDAGGACAFVLDGAGKTGGVQIELLSNTTATAAHSAASMCAVPPLQHAANDPFVLRPAFTPPSGSGNAAWMNVLGGTGTSVMANCANPPDCPRYGKWTVTAAAHSDVVLVLKNLQAGPPLLVLLNDGAELTIANIPVSPVPPVLQPQQQKQRAAASENEEPLLTDAAEDWCSYFSMVALQSNPSAAAPCPGKPPIPSCTPTLLRAIPHVHGHGMGIQTIACSSSQYP